MFSYKSDILISIIPFGISKFNNTHACFCQVNSRFILKLKDFKAMSMQLKLYL